MEIIESIAWISIGFVPTLLALELVSSNGRLRKYLDRGGAGLKLEEVRV